MIEENIKNKLSEILKNLGVSFTNDEIVLVKSDKREHGDYACNIALKKAKSVSLSPIDLANKIVSSFSLDGVNKVEAVMPGFLNFFLGQDEIGQVISQIIKEDKNYGNLTLGNNKKVNIEYVSANPTGLLHVGHARGAALGDCLSRIYSKAGYDVTREYYINDAGVQVLNLAKSVYARYSCLIKPRSAKLPSDGYHGKEIITCAKALLEKYGEKLIENNEKNLETIKKFSINYFLNEIKKVLHKFRVDQDVYTSEKSIKERGDIELVLEKLKPHCYTKDNALWLKTTDDGDDKDRVLIKSDGTYTYLLPDIAYHNDKFNRGFDYLLNIFGADHHGYITRLKSSQKALGHNPDNLTVTLVQMVKLFKDGEEFKMSKRTGNSITLDELLSLAPIDAIRYFFVSRSGSSHLDFDIDLARKVGNENPVYYCQYTHARLCSILTKGKKFMPLNKEVSLLISEKEKNLLLLLKEYPNVIASACKTNEPYKICNYVYDLSTSINDFYTNNRVLDDSSVELTNQRLGLVEACRIVLSNALDLIGVSAPKSMTIENK